MSEKDTLRHLSKILADKFRMSEEEAKEKLLKAIEEKINLEQRCYLAGIFDTHNLPRLFDAERSLKELLKEKDDKEDSSNEEARQPKAKSSSKSKSKKPVRKAKAKGRGRKSSSVRNES